MQVKLAREQTMTAELQANAEAERNGWNLHILLSAVVVCMHVLVHRTN